MNFAAIESRLNAACLARLANCTATLDGGEPIAGVFDNGSAAGISNMMLGSNPTFSCAASDAGAASRNKTLVVTYQSAATSYTVREVKPDGTGFTLLELEAQ